jgi:hypothetical protein
MVLVVDQDEIVAGLGIGKADAARARTVGDPPPRAGPGELFVGQGK